jgi:hypothetical protein
LSHWDEKAGRVSQSFDEWVLTDGDQRSFLRLGLAFAEQAYEQIWDEAGREPGDPDGPEQIDVFEERVGGLHEHDYAWMHCSGILRDAVTSFEVYLEKAREEILKHQGQPIEVPERAPLYRELKDFFGALGVDIDAEGVGEVRQLRHFLTHRRGEIRTSALRERYAAEAEGLGPLNVELSEAPVLDAMGALGRAARRIDMAVYRYSWGGVEIGGLRPDAGDP